MKFLLGFLTALIVTVIICLIIIYSGKADISAKDDEEGIMEWMLETAMERSVKNQSEEIKVPADLNDGSRIKTGFNNYKNMCEICHGAPGVEISELAKGLNPKAPRFKSIVDEWKPQEIFWITKNGIKLTGMPAWGETHSDEEIWSIVAFINRLPSLSAAEYSSLAKDTSGAQDEREHRH